MDYINITRFSQSGFISQKQTYFLDHLKYIALGKWKNEVEEGSSIWNLYIEQQKNLNYEFCNGVWAFVKGYESQMYLNHLPKWKVSELPCFEAKIKKDAIVYANDMPIYKSSIRTAEKAAVTMFIPESSLQYVYDVKEIDNLFLKKRNSNIV
jgi:hypothetical protein